jgi:hypothetical protein
MSNRVKSESNDHLKILESVCIIFLCFSFLGGYLFYRKNKLEIKTLDKEISGLNQQLDSFAAMKKPRRTGLKSWQLSQIYEIIAESANDNRIMIKKFVTGTGFDAIDQNADRKFKNPNLALKSANDLEITIAGNYPDLILFFEYLWQKQFYLFKKIEIKSNTQDPNSSIEVLLELTIPKAKGVQ